MNRKFVMFSAVLMAAMTLSLAVTPAMAKPGVLTVIVKDRNGNPIDGAGVYLYHSGVGLLSGLYTADPRGKVNIILDSAWVGYTCQVIYVGAYSASFTLEWKMGRMILQLA